MENIDFKKVSKAIEELKGDLLNKFPNWGKSNPRVAERQFLYGDVMDWLRDYKNELNLQERHFVAVHLIGEYVTKKTLL